MSDPGAGIGSHNILEGEWKLEKAGILHFPSL